MKKYQNFVLALIVLLPTMVYAAGVPSSFTYQGKALNAAGTAPLTTTVSFTLSITDPSGACILYQESQSSINLATTNGLFALQVGSLVGAGKRTAGTDPGLSMTQVFANAGIQLVAASGSCTSGYTPAANDARKLHVVITPTSGSPITISPDLSINAVPNAMVAESLQGFSPANFTPVGSVLTTTLSSCPSGYLATDGTSYPIATYPALATAYNYSYGGSGANFNVPNTSGLFIRSVGTQAVGGITYGTANNLGVVQSDQMQGHGHSAVFSYSQNSTLSMSTQNTAQETYGVTAGSGNAGNDGITIGDPTSDGTNGTPRVGLENRPVNIALRYCVKY
jgi:microcystin-dependent protein